MKYRLVILTEKEHEELSFIIGNGWDEGSFSGYGGTNPRVQESALQKFKHARAISSEVFTVLKKIIEALA